MKFPQRRPPARRIWQREFDEVLVSRAPFSAASPTVLGVSLVALVMAGCTANPTPLDRPGDVPAAFTAPVAKSAPIWPQANWWANFKADELAPLEETAQKENLDIAQAAARVLQAEAEDGVALSALFPTLGGHGRLPAPGQRP